MRMHELSITQGLVDAVLDKTKDRRVLEVRVKIGRLSGVLPDALRFCFDLVSEGTPLAGADLLIDEPHGLAVCRTCGSQVILPDAILLCTCGSADIEIRGGRELAVTSVEVV